MAAAARGSRQRHRRRCPTNDQRVVVSVPSQFGGLGGLRSVARRLSWRRAKQALLACTANVCVGGWLWTGAVSDGVKGWRRSRWRRRRWCEEARSRRP